MDVLSTQHALPFANTLGNGGRPSSQASKAPHLHQRYPRHHILLSSRLIFQSSKGKFVKPFSMVFQIQTAKFGHLLYVLHICIETSTQKRQAHALSSIANCDWPDEYPDLLQNLISLLSAGSPDSVHGAMQVFTEFIHSDLTEDQILPVLRQLLPVLLTILGSTEVRLFARLLKPSLLMGGISTLHLPGHERLQSSGNA